MSYKVAYTGPQLVDNPASNTKIRFLWRVCQHPSTTSYFQIPDNLINLNRDRLLLSPHLLSHSALSKSGKKTQEGRSRTRAWMTLIGFIVQRQPHTTLTDITSFSLAEARH